MDYRTKFYNKKKRQTIKAFEKYGKDKCRICWKENQQGNGAKTIGIENGLTTRQADCAIEAFDFWLKNTDLF